MTDLVVPYNWEPRNYQVPLVNAMLHDQVDRAAVCWHRRAGKDLTSINICTPKMLERVGLYWHVLPTYAQGRKIVWQGMDGTGRKFLDYIPPELVVHKRDDEMRVTLSNGSVYQVIGGDNVNRLVGSNPVGIIMSEYSLHNPECWDYIRPILNENGGWALFIYTPRGFNHGHTMMQNAVKSDRWFTEILTVNDTFRPDGRPVVSKELIQDDVDNGMPEELVRQEYYCDFTAPLVGAYYGQAMDEALKDGRIGEVPWEPSLPVYTGWDLGMHDAMVIWFYQLYDGFANYIDYYASSGVGLEHYAKMISEKPYVCRTHYAPHDIIVQEMGTGVRRIEVAWDLGLKMEAVPKIPLGDGIDASRRLIARSRFDAKKCEHGLDALRQYRRSWDSRNRVWGSQPVHDWCSHPADAYRTTAMAIRPDKVRATKAPLFKEKMTVGQMIREAKQGTSNKDNGYI